MMLHSPGNLAGNCSDVTVLELQQARMKWLQLEERQGQGQNGGLSGSELAALFCMANADYKEMGFERFLMSGGGGGGGELVFGEVLNLEDPGKPDPGFKNGWADFSCFETANSSFQGVLGPEMDNCALSRTSSCAPQPMEAAVAAVAVDGSEVCLGEKGKVGGSVGKESFKKRKLEKMQTTKEDIGEKRTRQSTEDEDSKITGQSNNNNNNNNNNSYNNSKSRSSKNNNSSSRETSVCTSKENSKASEVQKTDYIHVRARRGQATDSHSLAERARREKISERMKYLQDLVPGCNKITGKAGMLDEIINYVQSLQRQVEFLSMKLASINPRLDFSIGHLFCKEMFPAYTANFPAASEISDPAYLQFNPVQQQVSTDTCSGQEIGINPNAGRTVNTPNLPISSVFLDPSCLTQQVQPTLNWETSFPGIFNPEFHQGAATSFPSHQFTGQVESTNLKMEM